MKICFFTFFLEGLLFFLVFFSVFLSSFLLPRAFSCVQAFSSTKEEVLSSREKPISAGDVFLNFAKEHLGEKWAKKMGLNWPEKITKALEKWSPEEAKKFLNFLEKRIGKQDTINRIKSSSYFAYMSYDVFIERVDFFDQYMGEKKMTKRFRKSLRGLDRGTPNEIKLVADFVTSYIGKKKTIQIMEQNLQVFSGAKFSSSKEMVELMISYLGEKELVQKMSNAQDLRILLSRDKPEEFKASLKDTENYLGGGAEAKNRLKRVLQTNFRDVLW